MHQVCVGQGVGSGQPLLDPDELAGRVALEADEQEPGVELTGGRVEAVGVVEAAAQQLDAAVGGGRRLADVGPRGDDRLPVGPERIEPDRVVLAPPGQRRARSLEPPDGPLLDRQGGPGPGLQVDADAPGHQVGAAAQPRLVVVVAHPDVLVQADRCQHRAVGRPVVEPGQVARRRWTARPATGPAPGPGPGGAVKPTW